MGSVYRATRTAPIPEGAELTTRRGERIASWRDASGRKRTAPLTAGGDRVKIRQSTYTAKWRDGAGIVRTQSTGCRELAPARAVLADLERRAESVKAGLRTAAEDSVLDHQSTPIGEHVEAYLDHLRRKAGKGAKAAVSPAHVANVEHRLAALAEACGFDRLRDINRRAVERWVESQRAEGRLGAGTINGYTRALCAFGNWAVETGRLTANPIARPPKLDATADQRGQRRALTEGELRALLRAARLRPLAEQGRESVRLPPAEQRGRRTWTRAPLTPDTIACAADRARRTLPPHRVAELAQAGRERALIYKALALTGLRKGELASLTVGQIELDGPTPCARLNAGDAKSGGGADVPLRGDLARDIGAWLSERLDAARERARMTIAGAIPARLPHDEPLFRVPSSLLRTFDRDLEAAGIAKRDDRGRVADVHSLRHTFGSMLSRGGVAPRTAQAAMRHSTLDLTMNHYTDPRLLDVAGAMDALPALPLDEPAEGERAEATGTNGRERTPDNTHKRAPESAPESAPKSAPNSAPDPAQVWQNLTTDGTTAPNADAAGNAVSDCVGGGCHSLTANDTMERRGLEPRTSSLQSWHSTN